MRLIPSPTPFPLYRTNQIPSTTAASSLRKRYDVAPATLNNFPKDLLPSKEHRFASSLKNLHSKYPSYLPQTSYVMHVDDDDDEESEEDFLGFMNPFSCDTEESSGEEDLGHNFYGASNEILAERKFMKYFKYKKKKKKKKKIVLLKLVFAFLAFIAIKFLLTKAYKFFPAILAFVRRDELYSYGEHELDRDIDFMKPSASNDEQHSSIVPSSYEMEYVL